jgi:hypothetical protein
MEDLVNKILSIENIEKLIDLDGNYELLQSEKIYYCDCEILNYKNTIDLNLNFDWQPITINNHLITFKANDCILAAYNNEDEDCQFISLFTPDYIVIVSVIMGHPGIETSYIVYSNSDGSGPDLIDGMDAESLSTNLCQYYKEFLNDAYH